MNFGLASRGLTYTGVVRVEVSSPGAASYEGEGAPRREPLVKDLWTPDAQGRRFFRPEDPTYVTVVRLVLVTLVVLFLIASAVVALAAPTVLVFLCALFYQAAGIR